MEKIQASVYSEIGNLEAVIIHTPGREVENMTPENAQRALYSDILNLPVASAEFEQHSKVLQKFSKVFQVKELLCEILKNTRVAESLITDILEHESINESKSFLLKQHPEALASLLIEGVVMKKDNLTRYFCKERYSMRPLHNFFYTRDAAITVFDEIIIGRMANKVRDRESMIMEAIFEYHPLLNNKTINPAREPGFNPKITFEGGDILIPREDILLIGTGSRTSSQGIDFILDHLASRKGVWHIIVQELPLEPESFIHLDMVFTLLDHHYCMVYEPVIISPNKYRTVHITIDNGKVKISPEKNIIETLKSLGMDLEIVYCGGQSDPWIQEREQWHSGANFFAVGPGKVIGYGRNIYTIDELNKKGFEVLKATEVISGKKNPDNYKRFVITLEGSELPRGGGGARCMTMPLKRQKL